MIEIHFRRNPHGAWCDVDGKRFEASHPKGGVIYRLVVILADGGYEGQPFTAHDGRSICLRGAVSVKAVPKKYHRSARRSPERLSSSSVAAKVATAA